MRDRRKGNSCKEHFRIWIRLQTHFQTRVMRGLCEKKFTGLSAGSIKKAPDRRGGPIQAPRKRKRPLQKKPALKPCGFGSVYFLIKPIKEHKPNPIKFAVTMLAPAGVDHTKLAIIPIKKQMRENAAEKMTTGR